VSDENVDHLKREWALLAQIMEEETESDEGGSNAEGEG
jgi:hypothetical protein